MEATMSKASDAFDILLRSGFDLTTKEFFRVTLERLLKKYGVSAALSDADYRDLTILIVSQCAENDFKEMGLRWEEEDLAMK